MPRTLFPDPLPNVRPVALSAGEFRTVPEDGVEAKFELRGAKELRGFMPEGIDRVDVENWPLEGMDRVGVENWLRLCDPAKDLPPDDPLNCGTELCTVFMPEGAIIRG